MTRAELTPTTFDHHELKRSLIEFLKTKETFKDFDYDGSAINTIVDMLVRNTVYDSFLANMLANESFIESAQIRGNVVAHAQKLSYVPRSRVSARSVVDVDIIPVNPPTSNFVIVADPGVTFVTSVGGATFTFSTTEPQSFTYNSATKKYHATDIELYQGHYLKRNFNYQGEKIVVPNDGIDISTLKVTVNDNIVSPYTRVSSITDMGANSNVFFIYESNTGEYEISFGKNVLGREPSIGSTVTLEYISNTQLHANGARSFMAGITIGGYSNIEVRVKQPAYGGMNREGIESIRFNAPRAYSNQDRALASYDYVYLIKKEFPFLKSVISWGGEENKPPKYGTQFIAIIPDEGIEITRSLKNRIETYIRSKSVGSITPKIVDPIIFDTHLEIKYIVRDRVTTTSRALIESRIAEIVTRYSEDVLSRFGAYYNEAELSELLKGIGEIESVIINEKFSHTFSTRRGYNDRHIIDFDNKIAPRSVQILGANIVDDASNERIVDDGEGRIVYSYDKAGVHRTLNIGTVNYETGVVDFVATFMQPEPDLQVEIRVEEQNFYTRSHNVVRITSLQCSEFSKSDRA